MSSTSLDSIVFKVKTQNACVIYFQSNEPASQENESVPRSPFLSLDFLQPANVRDKEGRKSDHPEYDQNTLLVPEDFLNKQTDVSIHITY